ncbi:MAG TPA: YdcF family protein [Streptosporangiaceae bacterium]
MTSYAVRVIAAPVAGVVVVAALLGGEVEHWRSSRRRIGSRPGTSGTGEAIVVLGFCNRGPRANAVNRWRVRAALRSREPQLGPSRLVLCGGAVGGPVAEAEVMACYARESCGYPGVLITELTSRSTWENVRNAIPLIEDADRIKIVSNSLHAEQARWYLWRTRPDLAQRLVPAADYRFGELMLVKPLLAALGRWKLRNAAAVSVSPAEPARQRPAG